MPTKNIYVSESDIELFNKATNLAGGLSTAVVQALQQYVQSKEHEGENELMKPIELSVNDGSILRTKRFIGQKVARFEHKDRHRRLVSDIYLTVKGNYVVYERNTPDWQALGQYDEADWENPETWDSNFYRTSERAMSIYSTLEELKSSLPSADAEAIVDIMANPGIEDLDI